MREMTYRQARHLIDDADLLLFGGRALWPSIPIRWWDNGYRAFDPDRADLGDWWRWRCWLTLGDWSHSEFANWDHKDSDPVLESWGSVAGGPRKIALSTLLDRYGSFGWAPFMGTEQERRLVLAMARRLWRPGAHYPSARQYLRTALRRIYCEKVDCDPAGFVCHEWVGTCHRLYQPAGLSATDLIGCGRFGAVTRIVK